MKRLGALLIQVGYKLGGSVPVIAKATDWETRDGVWLTNFQCFNPIRNKFMIDYNNGKCFITDL